MKVPDGKVMVIGRKIFYSGQSLPTGVYYNLDECETVYSESYLEKTREPKA